MIHIPGLVDRFDPCNIVDIDRQMNGGLQRGGQVYAPPVVERHVNHLICINHTIDADSKGAQLLAHIFPQLF